MANLPESIAGEAPQPIARHTRRWLWRVVVISVAAALLLVFHRPLLQAVAQGLTVDEPPQKADCVLILSGDGCFERAAEMYHRLGARQVLLVESYPDRIVRYGIVPSFETIARDDLLGKGVIASDIVVIPGQVHTTWQRLRRLGEWLQQHPQRRVTILCPRTSGRQVRLVADTVLAPDLAERLTIAGLPHQMFDEGAWWRERQGWKMIFFAWAQLGYDAWCGEETEEWREWDPDAYEKALH